MAMKRKPFEEEVWFLSVIIVLSCCFWACVTAASGSEQLSVTSLSSPDSNSQSELTEELRTLVRSLRQLRSDYYEKQSQHADKIQQLRNTSEKLQAEAEELRSRESQIDKSLSEIQSDIEKLKNENKNDQSMELSVVKRLDEFVTTQAKEVEEGIPYRKNDRLARLKGNTRAEQTSEDQSVVDVLGRIWSFSQEELRIARSGETFTDQVELSKGRLQYARLFRVGHQILGYVTEQDDRAGIWMDGTGWEKAEKTAAESVKEAIEILDRTNVPKYIQIPVKIKSADIKNKNGKK
jgi:predicted RNase H-like nuclease (RuvC/YqgF family)